MKWDKHIGFALFAVMSVVVGCVPPTDEVPEEVLIDFTNPDQQKVYNLQHQGLTDSLYPYFHHRNPSLRYLAATAFASIRDSAAVDSLLPLLYDRVDAVRVGTAYVLGQLGSSRAEQPLVDAFERFDTAGFSQNFNAAILEAIGKCGSPKFLDALASISTYKPTDTLLLEGQAWGVYRYSLRNMTTADGTRKMVAFATGSQYPASARFIAANYLMRSSGIDLSQDAEALARTLAREDDARVRMALAIALGKTKNEKALNALLYRYNLENDYRVQCNIIRALSNFDYEKVKTIVEGALQSPRLPVAITAADYFVQNGTANDGSLYWQWAKNHDAWEVKMTLYTAASKYIPLTFEESRKYLNWELKRLLETTDNPYQKGAALKALAANGWNYRYIRDVGYLFASPIVRTASVEALADIARRPDFNRYFSAAPRVRKELGGYFVEAIMTGDAGMVSVAASVLREPELGFQNTIDSLAPLENILKHLNRPQDAEAYIELRKTINFLKGQDPTFRLVPKSDHRIDWKLLNSLKENSRIAITTNAGEIGLELLPGIAPGTVANFVTLVQDGYYNEKNFHRVVPNFVIQGGCNRGDGYGSLSYTIRSELPYLHYDREGLVGMASAGNHTESAQFFITHSPTPHLDGNYTIFAKVVSGMEIVHKMRIGDVIRSAALVETK